MRLLFLMFLFIQVSLSEAQLRTRYVPRVAAQKLDSLTEVHAAELKNKFRAESVLIYTKVYLDEILSPKDSMFVPVRNPFEVYFFLKTEGKVMVAFFDHFSAYEPAFFDDSGVLDSVLYQQMNFCKDDFIPVFDTTIINDAVSGNSRKRVLRQVPSQQCVETVSILKASQTCTKSWFEDLSLVPGNKELLLFRVLLQTRKLSLNAGQAKKRRLGLWSKQVDISLFPGD